MSKKMIFKRKGLIFKVENNNDWMISHAQVPFAFPLNEDTIRIYFATRDKKNRSVTTFIETDAKDLKNIKYVHNKICLGLGKLGMHDESGAMPSCILKHNNSLYLYYTGWNIGVDVSYRTSIGLAISKDNGITFERYSDGPILDRSIHDPCFSCQPFVLRMDGKWKMWYLSCTQWCLIDDQPEPFYHVKYAESTDGINWNRKGEISLDYNDEIDAVGNPTVLFENGIYKMFFSYRKADGYRVDKTKAYKLGYAESNDGIEYSVKKDVFEVSGKRELWESTMNAYPHVIKSGNNYYLFYNGNGFGKSGFGYAILKET